VIKLLKAFEKEALEMGANVIEIEGIGVVNPKLMNGSVIAKKLGYIFNRLSDNSFKLTKILR
jgi:hypothetical protein